MIFLFISRTTSFDSKFVCITKYNNKFYMIINFSQIIIFQTITNINKHIVIPNILG